MYKKNILLKAQILFMLKKLWQKEFNNSTK